MQQLHRIMQRKYEDTGPGTRASRNSSASIMAIPVGPLSSGSHTPPTTTTTPDRQVGQPMDPRRLTPPPSNLTSAHRFASPLNPHGSQQPHQLGSRHMHRRTMTPQELLESEVGEGSRGQRERRVVDSLLEFFGI